MPTTMVAAPTHAGTSNRSRRTSPLVARHVFDTLIQYRELSTDVEPALAARWTVSRDGLVWTFALREGVRYPETLLQLQGRGYARYHMGNPVQFYNDEERWEVAREIYRNQEQNIEPYFILWRDEGALEPEFLLVMPFTPRQRPLMAGWLAGRSDGEHYGRLLAYVTLPDGRLLNRLLLERGPQRIPNLVGMKFTSPMIGEFQRCVEMEQRRFEMYFGVDEMLLSALAVGADRVIGSTYTIAAPLYRRVIEHIRAQGFTVLESADEPLPDELRGAGIHEAAEVGYATALQKAWVRLA